MICETVICYEFETSHELITVTQQAPKVWDGTHCGNRHRQAADRGAAIGHRCAADPRGGHCPREVSPQMQSESCPHITQSWDLSQSHSRTIATAAGASAMGGGTCAATTATWRCYWAARGCCTMPRHHSRYACHPAIVPSNAEIRTKCTMAPSRREWCRCRAL